MQCPACNVTLSMSSREGVEIDFCPQCRGVWLDRGELDKIIDRERAGASAPAPVAAARFDDRRDRDRDRDRDRYDDDRRRHDSDHKYDKKKKRKGFLEDLFEFG